MAHTHNIPEKKAEAPITAPRDQTLVESAVTSPAIASPGIVFQEGTADISQLPKTTGEKAYDVIQFMAGKVAMMAAAAGLAYVARYGKDHYGPIPNVFKQFQGWLHDKLLHNKIYPLAKKGEFGERIAGATANTALLFHGGNVFAPIMKVLENNHENIANFVNKRWGKPGEEEIAHERLKDKPHQTWGDVLKGRLITWGLVFTGVLTLDTIIGKNKKANMPWFDWYEEKFGRWMAGFTKSGKDIAKLPVTTPLNAAQDANTMYRVGKIVALDIYFASVAIALWNFFTRLSAQKRHDEKQPDVPPVTSEAMQIVEPASMEEAPAHKHTDAITPRADRAHIRSIPAEIKSLGEKVIAQRQLLEHHDAQLQPA